MQLLKYLLVISICAISYSQTTPEGGQAVYELVPGTKNNSFELSFSNSSTDIIELLNISVQESPDWIEFSSSKIDIQNVKNTDKPIVQFYFNISDNAPIGEETVIKFRITDNKNRKWFKSYNVKVAPPKLFEVYQNYPNPFNPGTTIKYAIPQDAFVSVKVFNVLGERVAELVNKDLKNGMHEIVFNAANLSSGFYFYRVEAKGLDGTKYYDSKKMILLR